MLAESNLSAQEGADMAISAVNVAVGTTAVKLSAPSHDVIPGQSLLVSNTGTVTVFLGGPDVTTGAGFPLVAGASVPFTLDSGEEVWAVSTASTSVATLNGGV